MISPEARKDLLVTARVLHLRAVADDPLSCAELEQLSTMLVYIANRCGAIAPPANGVNQ